MQFISKSNVSRYEDLQLRIPRDEVKEIEKIVLAHLRQIDPGADGIVCGSYRFYPSTHFVTIHRRGKLTSGDVDILIYATDGREMV